MGNVYLLDCTLRDGGYVNDWKFGRNNLVSIFERLDPRFTFEQAIQQSIAVKGAGVTRNSIHQMLKNWRRQGLIVQRDECYIKLNK